MNWLDVVLLVLLVWSIASSLRKGLVREVVGLASVILALAASVWFYGTAGGMLSSYLSSKAVANLLGFFLIFCAVMLAGAVVNFALGKALKLSGLSIVDHILGAAFGALRGILISIALITGIMAFSQGDEPPASIVRSRVAPYVIGAARAVSALAPHELTEGFRRTYDQVSGAWKKKTVRAIPYAPDAQKG